MEPSRHNIISRLHGTEDQYFIVNLLSGQADLITSAEAGSLTAGQIIPEQEYIRKGYLVDKEEERKLFRSKYLDFLDVRETDEVQLFYVPSYACNFGCSYCYQEGYGQGSAETGSETVEAFFRYVDRHFRDRKKYITLFGGEPLTGEKQNVEFIDHFIRKCHDHGIALAIVTNGYRLKEFVPVLSRADIREIQVTLDGTEEVHNRRRPLKNGAGTFQQITLGIDAALEAGLPVNLRVVLDRENISNLGDLADFAIEKGWTTSPAFKTQLGRNYELHYCQSQQAKLYSRIDLYRDLYELILKHPPIMQFHKPAYSVSRFLLENGELPSPLFDSCPGCKTEWAFDYTGRIYSCTATVGKPGEELGTFFPEEQLQTEKINTWQQRDVLSISECANCNLQLACGGGCASVAYNRTNNLHAPDCRPVKELMELGMALYNGLRFEV